MFPSPTCPRRHSLARGFARWLLLSITTWRLVAAVSAGAMPALPRLQTFEQPDGTTFQGYLRGDEHAHWLETSGRFPMARGKDGFLYYVSRYEGDEPVLGNRRAHLGPLLSQGHLDPPAGYDSVAEPFDDGQLRTGAQSPQVLFILVDYQDQPATYTNPKTWANKLYDADEPWEKSVVDYYLQASQGVAQLVPAEETHKKADNGVVGWLRLSGNHPDPGQYDDPNAQGPASSGADVVAMNGIYLDALDAADPYVDFAKFDLDGDGAVSAGELAIVVVVSGYDQATAPAASPSLWPRKTVGSVSFHDGIGLSGEFAMVAEIQQENGVDHSTAIGTVVHELGHLIFGLPDLYDLDYSSDGIGPYGVMGYGAYGSDPAVDSWSGETPVLPDAWQLYKLGWAPAAASSLRPIQLHSTGNPLADATLDPRVGRVKCSDDGDEYFLVQYRTEDGYDRGLDSFLDSNGFSPGVLIFHVDESVDGNRVDGRRLVDVEEANDVDLSDFMPQEGNFWVDGVDDRFDAASSPSSAYNDGTPSYASIAVGPQTSAIRPPLLGSFATFPLEHTDTVAVTMFCKIPALGSIGAANQLP